jgi:MarR family transcriptional regulator for hemolysin
VEERLSRIVALTGKAVREQFDRNLAAVDSSLNTYLILRTVAQRAGMSQRQLAATLAIEAPTITRLLDRLSAEGLLVRLPDPDDRRISRVALTLAGHAHLDRVEHRADELDRVFQGMFTAAEIATLRDLLTRIRDRYGKEADVDPARAPSLR